jgi:hypothetical protein
LVGIFACRVGEGNLVSHGWMDSWKV